MSTTAKHDHRYSTPARDGWYRRIHARLMAMSTESYNQMVQQYKQALFAQLSGTVLEIGAGTGANLEFLPRDIAYIAVEPSLAMQAYLITAAEKQGVRAEVRTGIAEQLPIADNSIDHVISTLVLCSVDNTEKSIAEIKRVLKPGGMFIFIEHVAAGEGTWLRRWQNLVNPAWQLIADGCHPNREISKVVEKSGFSKLTMKHFHLPVGIAGPHIAGIAEK